MKYRVAWNINGYQGHGNWTNVLSVTQAWVDLGNKDYGRSTHWVEYS